MIRCTLQPNKERETMAGKHDKASSRPSHKRESTKRNNGYRSRQKARTDKNIIARLDKHIEVHDTDKVAREARRKRLVGTDAD